MGLLEPSVGSAHRAGESSALVAEQFAFHQSTGQRRAVQFDIGAVFPKALVVDGSGDELFSSAGFTLNQDRSVGTRHHLECAPDGLQARAGADENRARDLPGVG